MIAVTFALPAESKVFVSRLQNKRHYSFQGSDIVCGEIGSRPLTIFHTGVGRRVAETRLIEFLGHQSVHILISSGFAGGVGLESKVGDLFLAENVSDPHLFALAQRSLKQLEPRIGKLFTSSGIIHSPAERMELARARGADAIDMETDVIAEACVERGIPILSLRAISDTLHEPFPAPPAVLFDIEQQKTPIVALASHLLASPAAIPRLIRFNRQIRAARERLTAGLVTLIEDQSG
jgi:adenosylhomocysteine nucleosidase